MKSKKGFTLVELLSTIAILAIVLGIVSAAYIGITKHLKASFYKTLEESILVSGSEYYSYTKERPVMFGDEKRISLKDLVENKYSNDIVDRKGNRCNLATSYVGAYKDNYDKTNYYVCLTCDGDSYTSDKPECSGNIGYSLQVTATVNDTNKVYQANNWVNSYVKLTFKTLNNVEKVYVKDNSLGTSFNCTMTGTSIKTCSINVNKSGNYEYYGISSSNQETKHGHINILVDTTNPHFDVYEDTTLITSNSITKNITSNSININNIVKNIVDSDSKVQSIRYSFEKQGSSKNYVTIDNNLTEFNINKNLGLGKYELIIEIKDYAGNIGSRTITYQINKNITKPDSSYCNDLTYNGYEQTLTKTPGEGYTFTNNKKTDAGSYEVTANLNENYVFSDGSTSAKFTCVIKRQSTATTGSCQDVTYNGGEQVIAKGGLNVTYSDNLQTNAGTYTVTIKANSNYTFSDGSTTSKTLSCSISKKAVTITAKDQNLNGTNTITNNTSQITTSGLISGHSVTSITLTQSTTSDTTNGTITPSGAVIKSGTTDVTSNYSITYNKGKLTIVTIKYCANFYLNGASKIDGVASNKTNVCCSPGSNTSCTITSPTITPTTNFDVLGWGSSASSTTIIADATGDISLRSNQNFYAVTISSEDSTKTYNIELNLNGATSFTLGGTTYNKSSVFTCQTGYAYNGGSIPTTCKFTLPTITRTSGTVYGWDTNENKEGSPTYTQGQVLTISSDIVLYAITSRTIKLSYNGNGGTTTLPTQSKEVYNDNEGVWFDIPAYDRANMCRSKTNDFLGYKYSGLATSASSGVVNYCQGNKVYATEDMTLYALWKTVYRTASHSVSSGLRVRSEMSTSSTHLCTIPSGKKVYLTGSVSSCISSRKWYPVIYGTCSGYSSAGSSCSTANFTLDAAVKNSCEYTDYYCSGTNYNLNLTPKNVTLNLYSGPTTAQLQIQEQCGGLKSATSSDTSIVGVDTSGKVTTVSGSVASGSSKTATLTFTTNAGCTDTVSVVVKNINEVHPTVSISISGETYSSGYKSGAVATVTCESSEGISSYTAKDNTGDTGSWSTNTSTKKVKKITLSSASSSRKVSVSCTSTNGLSASTSKTVKIYVYSASSACGVSSYSYSGTCTCKVVGMGQITKSCNSSVYFSGGCSSWCKTQANGSPIEINSGSCSRTTNYQSCYHT